MLTEKVTLGSVNAYELSLEFWLCNALIERLILPFQFLEKEIEDDTWFCIASFTERELYLLFDGLEKLTDAEKLCPGWALASCVWDHLSPKLRLWKKSLLPLSPFWSFE